MNEHDQCDDHEPATVEQIRRAFPEPDTRKARAEGAASSAIRRGMARLRRTDAA